MSLSGCSGSVVVAIGDSIPAEFESDPGALSAALSGAKPFELSENPDCESDCRQKIPGVSIRHENLPTEMVVP